MTMVSIAAGAMPAASKAAGRAPALSVVCPPVPVSISTSFLPVLTRSAVNEIGSTRGGMKAAASASSTAAASALRMKPPSIGDCQTPS